MHQKLRSGPRLGGGGIYAPEQIDAVNRVDGVEYGGGAARLVGLEVPDEMPAKRQFRCVRDLLQTFLHLVFGEIQLACVCGGTDVMRGERLGDGDEAN